jgi:hypothetical protein
VALLSGGIRFYDADHKIQYNYIDGVVGTGFQDPLILDTGDAETTSTNLSGHWRVVGAQVQRNVLVNVPRGITIGDNYSLVPRNCTVTDNLVVDADTGAAITQRVAPSATVLDPNLYYASTTAAGMTVGADTIARKPGYGPRLTYLTATAVGPAAYAANPTGAHTELGGTVAVPADVLRIGTAADQNQFALQYVANGATSLSSVSFADVAAGFTADPYFKVVTNTISGVVVPAVQFQVRADVAAISGAELRETRADGTSRQFDAMSGGHSLTFRGRITHLPAADPEVLVAQLHDGVNGHRVAIGTQLVGGQTALQVWLNGTPAAPLLDSAYVVGNEFRVEIRIRDGGVVEIYYQGSTVPVLIGQLAPSGAGASWRWRVGATGLFTTASAGSSTEYASVELRDLSSVHAAPQVNAGEDARVVRGLPFNRTALEPGITNVISRRWTIVSRPATAPPDQPPPPSGDQTLAAVRNNWGTPLPSSDEFNYVGPPDPNKWSLPGSDWAGHDNNGRRRPERQTVDGSKLIMTGLANGDSGWMAHKVNREYGRYEARVRAYNTGTSNGNLYSPVLLIWPESDSRKNDGEYDYYEPGSPGSTKLTAFMHYPGDGDQQKEFNYPSSIDLSQWQNIGFEWTSAGVKGYLNGVQWFSYSGGSGSGRRNIQAMGPGFATIQLDNFDGTNQTPAQFEVEFFRLYSV